MEAFTLLKYWRSTASAKTITTASTVSPESSDDDDGPFFDLEFSLNPTHESDKENAPTTTTENDEDRTESESDAEEEEEEEVNVALSPSDERLFFKGDLVSIQPSSILLNAEEDHNSNKIPVFLVKSATKFRVLLLKLKKSKPGSGDAPESQGSKLLSLKFKVDEAPLVSLFTRDNSSKENNNGGVKGLTKRNNVEEDEEEDANGTSEETRVAKEVVHKYLKMVKPFYIRVSKRYVEKLKFSGNLSFPGGGGGGSAVPAAEKGVEVAADVAPVKSQLKQGNSSLQAGLKVVRKRLGKSRSASAAVEAAPAPVPASNRRDDSLLQVQDGIQGAILHCKRSFNASRDVESSILCRSVSDPSHEKSVIMPKGSKASTTSFSSEAAKESKA